MGILVYAIGFTVNLIILGALSHKWVTSAVFCMMWPIIDIMGISVIFATLMIAVAEYFDK